MKFFILQFKCLNYLPAIVSISTRAPIGSDFTAKAERAGHSD
jgi:hypothetical protein